MVVGIYHKYICFVTSLIPIHYLLKYRCSTIRCICDWPGVDYCKQLLASQLPCEIAFYYPNCNLPFCSSNFNRNSRQINLTRTFIITSRDNKLLFFLVCICLAYQIKNQKIRYYHLINFLLPFIYKYPFNVYQ